MLFVTLALMAAAPADGATTLRVTDTADHPCTLWINGTPYEFSDKSRQAEDALHALGRSGGNYSLDVGNVPVQCGINWTARLSAAGVNMLSLPFFR